MAKKPKPKNRKTSTERKAISPAKKPASAKVKTIPSKPAKRSKPTISATPRKRPAPKSKPAPAPKKKHHLARDKPPANPVKRTKSKLDTPAKLADFIGYYLENGNVFESARLAGVSRRLINMKKKDDPLFAKVFAEAREIAFENLEGEAFRRAFTGTLKPVFSFGQVCGHIREYSDTLTIFLLKGNKKELYGDSVKLAGDADNPVELRYTDRTSAVETILAFLTGGKAADDLGNDKGDARGGG